VHHEIKMLAEIGKGGSNISIEQAIDQAWSDGVG